MPETLYAIRALALKNIDNPLTKLVSLTRPSCIWDSVYKKANCQYVFHIAPNKDCECGLYAHLNINYFIENGYHYILFLVKCNGKIIVHDNGVVRCGSQELIAIIGTPWLSGKEVNWVIDNLHILIICQDEATEIVNRSIKENEIDYEWKSPIDEINKQATQLSKVIASFSMSTKELQNVLNQLRSQAPLLNALKDKK